MMRNFIKPVVGAIFVLSAFQVYAQQNIHGTVCKPLVFNDQASVNYSWTGIKSFGNIEVICPIDRTAFGTNSLTITVLAENSIALPYPPYTPTIPISCTLGTVQRNGFSSLFDSGTVLYTSNVGKVHTFNMTLTGKTNSGNRDAVNNASSAYLQCSLPNGASISGIVVN